MNPTETLTKKCRAKIMPNNIY